MPVFRYNTFLRFFWIALNIISAKTATVWQPNNLLWAHILTQTKLFLASLIKSSTCSYKWKNKTCSGFFYSSHPLVIVISRIKTQMTWKRFNSIDQHPIYYNDNNTPNQKWENMPINTHAHSSSKRPSTPPTPKDTEWWDCGKVIFRTHAASLPEFDAPAPDQHSTFEPLRPWSHLCLGWQF